MNTNSPILALFQPSEVELMLIGTSFLDFEELKKSTTYEGGYTSNTKIIKQFWDIVINEFDQNQKKELLKFITSSNRAPIGGLGELDLKIQRATSDTEQLPTSSTCYITLLLPEYKSKEKLKNKLLLAIENSSGFGLR